MSLVMLAITSPYIQLPPGLSSLLRVWRLRTLGSVIDIAYLGTPLLFCLPLFSFKPLLPAPLLLFRADDIPIGLMPLCPAPSKEQRDTRSNQRREQCLFR